MVQCPSHREALGSQMFLGFANRVFAKVEDACGQHSISLSRVQDIGEVLKFACAAACYDGDSHRL